MMEGEMPQPKVQHKPRPRRADPPDGYLPVRDDDGRLLFFYNPSTRQILIKPSGLSVKRIELDLYHAKAAG